MIVERYEILGRLGGAPMGRAGTFRARPLAGGGPEVVLAIVEPGTGPARRARRDLAALASLAAPGLPRVLDRGKIDPLALFVVFERVDGPDIARCAAEGAEASEIARRLGEALEALAALHGAGLLHGDVKPANLRIAPGPGGGRAVLVGGGLARPLEGGAARLAFVAPEVLRGERPDPRADLFSLGATIYAALGGDVGAALAPAPGANGGSSGANGARGAHGERGANGGGGTPRGPGAPGGHGAGEGGRIEALRVRLSTPLVPIGVRRPDVPAELEAAIARLVALDPADRFASAEEALAALGQPVRAGRAVPRPQRVLAGRFVGFEAERRRLGSALDRAIGLSSADALSPPVPPGESPAEMNRRAAPRPLPLDGAPPPIAVTIGGPPGAGKTRLLAELKVHAELAGAVAIACAAGPADRERPFGAALVLLRAARSAFTGSAAALGLARAEEALEAGRADEAPGRRIALAADELVLASRRRPVAIFLDDFEDAAEETRDLVREIERAAPLGSGAVATTAAGDDPASPPARIFVACAARAEEGEGGGNLPPIGADDAAELLRSALGLPAVPRGVAQALARETGGRPGAVVLVARELAASGAASIEVAARLVGLGLREAGPAHFLETLLPATRRALAALAALGVPAALETVAEAAGLEVACTERALDALEDDGLVREEGGLFSALDRAAAEAALAFEGREASARGARTIERAALAALEARRAPVSLLADRALRGAVDEGRAARLALAAADDALAAGASARARRLYRAAADRRGTAVERARALEGLGEESLRMAERLPAGEGARAALAAEAAAAFARLAEAARRRADALAESRALERLGRAKLFSGDEAGAARALERAAEVARAASAAGGPAPASALILAEAAALRARGELALAHGEQDRALELFERARALAAEAAHARSAARGAEPASAAPGAGLAPTPPGARDEDAELEASRYLRAIGRAFLGKGAYAEARTCADRALALEEQLGRRRSIPETLELLSEAAVRQGDHALALEARGRAVALARELGDLGAVAAGLIGLALVLHERGEVEAARGRYRESLAIARRLGDRGAIVRALSGLGELALERRDFEEALAVWNEVATLENAGGGGVGYGLALARLGAAHLGRGEPARALACYAQSRKAVEGDATLEAEALRGEADALALEGDLLEAQELYGRAAARAEAAAPGAGRAVAREARSRDGARPAGIDGTAARSAAWIGLARVLLRRGELAQARARLADAERGAGANGSRLPAVEAAARATLAILESLAGELEAARRIARSLPAVSGGAAERAEALLAAGEPEAALEVAREAPEPMRGAIEGAALLDVARLASAPAAEGGGTPSGWRVVRPPETIAEAEARLERAFASARERGLRLVARAAALALADAAILAGDDARAGRWLDEAAPRDESEDRLQLARTEVRRLALLLRRGALEEARALEGALAGWVPALGVPVLEVELFITAARGRRLRGDGAKAREALARAAEVLARLERRAGPNARHPALVSLRQALRAEERAAPELVARATDGELAGLLARIAAAAAPDLAAIVDFARRAAGATAAALATLDAVAAPAGAGEKAPLGPGRGAEPALAAEAGPVDEAFRAAAIAAARGAPPPAGAIALPVRAGDTAFGAILLGGASGPGVAPAAAAAADLAALVLGAARAAEREAALARALARSEEKRQAAEERLERTESDRHREREDLRRALELSRRELEAKYNYSNIVGRSEAMRSFFLILDKITDSHVPVLIQGESGTGKELVAKAIHFNGPRRDHPFLSINCAALPETLLEGELFGHVKGAFTGADRDKVGLFEAAHRGTLFLDEVGEMSPGMQVKLLRALQEGEVRPVGAKSVKKVDVRIVSASNQDLRKLVEEGRFRMDLYYRLNVIHVLLPPLRERREDIPLLVEHFLETVEGGAKKEIAPGVMEALLSYHWPGNVRELENEMRRAIALSGPVIQPQDLSAHIKRPSVERYDIGHPEGLTLKARLEILERRILKDALARADGNKTRCAKELGLSRFGFLKKLDKYGLR